MEISFYFRTFSSDGILLYLTDLTTTHYLLIYINNGQVVLNISRSGLDLNQLSTTNTYNDGNWYTIAVIVNELSITLTVGSEALTMDTELSTTFDPSGIVSIGSPIYSAMDHETASQLAAALQTIANEPRFSASGCFRYLQINGVIVNISESAFLQQNVSLAQCPAEVYQQFLFTDTYIS